MLTVHAPRRSLQLASPLAPHPVPLTSPPPATFHAHAAQGELWRLLSGLVVHGGLGPVAVVLLGLGLVAPRVEASLG